MCKKKLFYIYKSFIISAIIIGCYTEDIDIENLPSYIDPPIEPTTHINITHEEENVIKPREEPPPITNVTRKFVKCMPLMGAEAVQIVNDTELIQLLLPDGNITNKETEAKCICVLFYSKYCPFSSLAAPHFNALPRAYPDIKMVAINAIMYHMFNTQNGIVGVPSLLLIHNGKIIDKFNESDYTLEQFSRFLTKNTGIPAADKSFVTSADFAGPVTSIPHKETDVLLMFSWWFIIACAVYYFTMSKWWQWIVESVQHNWRESEAQAQHEHAD